MTEAGPGRDAILAFQNRPHVLQEVERQVKRYRRRRRPFSLIVVAIQNLDWFEDTLGRAAGQSVLGYAADFIKTHVREVDVWYLCTRDEFMVSMDETDAQAARILVARLAAEAKNTKFAVGPDRVTLAMSFRTVTCPDDGEDAQALLGAAGLIPARAPLT